MANINLIDLPIELLHCIFDRLDTMTILYSLRPVLQFNKSYQRLTSLTIHDCKLPLERLRSILITVPSLTYLKLVSSRSVYGSVFDGSFWEQFIQTRFPQLKKFEFCFTYPIEGDIIIHSVNSIITSFRSSFWIHEKRWFTVCDHFIKSRQIAVYTKPICMNRYETLIKCEAMPVNSNCRLIEYSNNIENKTLTTLDLKGCRIGGQIIQDLADGLSDDTTIETLHIPFNTIRNDGIQYIVSGLEGNKTLTTLNLQFCEVEDSGVQYLALLLMNSTTLLSLNLSNNYLGVLGTQYLCHALMQNITLTTLDLSGNNLGIEGAKVLADALPYMTTLVTLNILKTQILDQGAQAIALALLSNTSLKALDLRGNCIEEPGAQQFIHVLRNNTV
ncbi:unnamed protein product [Adineta steineri]|nr:unnamed protein product [Adineta steineri]CAF1464361.1 unnamed protein product [Adineta steineri]